MTAQMSARRAAPTGLAPLPETALGPALHLVETTGPQDGPATSPAPSRLGRVLRALPLIGRVIREVEADTDNLLYLIVIFVTALVLAVLVWGLPALVLTAVSMVPVMFVYLIVISRPW